MTDRILPAISLPRRMGWRCQSMSATPVRRTAVARPGEVLHDARTGEHPDRDVGGRLRGEPRRRGRPPGLGRRRNRRAAASRFSMPSPAAPRRERRARGGGLGDVDGDARHARGRLYRRRRPARRLRAAAGRAGDARRAAQGSMAALPDRIGLPSVSIRGPISTAGGGATSKGSGGSREPAAEAGDGHAGVWRLSHDDVRPSTPAGQPRRIHRDPNRRIRRTCPGVGASAVRPADRSGRPRDGRWRSRCMARGPGRVRRGGHCVVALQGRQRADRPQPAGWRAAVSRVVSWRLREAVAAMHRAGRMTGGRFDPSVLTVLEAIGEHGSSLAAPGAAEAGTGQARLAAGAFAGLDRPRPIRVPARPLDTGGIGKGLALRWAARRALATMPTGRSCCSMPAAMSWPRARRWRRARRRRVAGGDRGPARRRAETKPIAVVALRTGAIATSSVRVRNWLAPGWPGGPPPHRPRDACPRERPGCSR